MKRIFLTTVICNISFYIFSQSFSPAVIGSSGTFATSASGSMTWTIGEVMTETYSSAGNFFTQGFHQPDTTTLTIVNDFNSSSLSIFPNPVLNNLYIDFSNTSENYFIELFDMQGKLLHRENVSDNANPLMLSFCDFSEGVYLLNIVNQESYQKKFYKIIKSK